MDHTRRRRIESIFQTVADLPESERSAALARECGDDAALREEVERLLSASDEAMSGFLETQEASPSGSARVDSSGELPSEIGGYRIVSKIGEGGMGIVYQAEQENPKRTVALKVIRSGVLTRSLLRRFEHEAQVLGRLQHPGIAQIYEAGTSDTGRGPQPFFVMEYVRGVSLSDYVKDAKLGTRKRLELVANICDAVHHAHQKGVIHRDLKPGNILVDTNGQPKILDFGVARATDSDTQMTTMQTDVGQLIGTLAYMSPEQVAAEPDELDTRSDVYALGVIIYELLAGHLPFDLKKKMVVEAVRIIREDDPTPLSSVSRAFRGDVETIVSKALEKDKARRYQSATELGSDIRRYLKDEPIVARPASTAYQFRKFAQRNKALVGGVAALFIVVTGFGVWMTVLYARADQLRTDAEQALDDLETVSSFQQSMLSNVRASDMGKSILAELSRNVRASLEAENSTEEETEASMEAFGGFVSRINATDLALKVLDDNVLGRAAETIEEDFADRPILGASLKQTIASTYRKLGQYEQALKLQTTALATRRTELGDRHPDTLVSINNLGLLLQRMGKLAEAVPYFREAIDGQRARGHDQETLLIAIGNMGVLLQDLGRFAEAEPYTREALDIGRRALGNDHPHTLTSMSNMGLLLSRMGKLKEAEPFYREALEETRRVQGQDHPNTLVSISNLGSLLRRMNRLAEAEPYYTEVLERRRRVLGDEHARTLRSVHKYGMLLLSMGREDEAERYFREALAGRQRKLGPEHPHTLQSMNVLGSLMTKRGRFDEAQVVIRQTLEGRRRVLGEDHRYTIDTHANLGSLMREMGRLDEALAVGTEAVDRARAKLPPGGPYLPRIIRELGKTLAKLQRFSEAEEAMLEAQQKFEKLYGRNDPNTVGMVESLVELYTAWHQNDANAGHDDDATMWRARLPEPK